MNARYWLTDDLTNMLRALALSSFVPGVTPAPEYVAGFQTALLLVAVAVGVPIAEARTLVDTRALEVR